MDCPSCRDVVSAQLDGEAAPEESLAAEHHLASCQTCRDHRRSVERLHRAVRVVEAEPVPDLAAAILAAAPAPRHEAVRDVAPLWRVGLVLVAVAQLAAALAHLGGDHLARDQASWEVALAAGFVWAAWRPSRSVGLVPVTAVLTLLLLVNGGLAPNGNGTHHLLAPLGLLFLVLAIRTPARRSILASA